MVKTKGMGKEREAMGKERERVNRNDQCMKIGIRIFIMP